MENTKSLEDSLKKIVVTRDIDKFSANDTPEAEKVIKEILKAIKKAKENGWKSITISADYFPGDENNLAENSIILSGQRLENDKEWEARLKEEKRSRERAIESHERFNPTATKTVIEKINEALSKSPLKCEKCGSAGNTCMESGGGIKKLSRLCYKCAEIIHAKYLESINNP